NNTYLRNFAVTEDRYAIDGIGVHPSENLNVGSLGTNSFSDAADGFMLMSYYDISQTVAIMGVEILLSSATVPGGSIIVALHDTADVFADDVTIPLEQTDVIDVLQSDVDAGVMTIMFEEPFEAEPNAYFASVEMFSNSNASDIRILNDLTVPQPFYSTMIYIPNDQVYSNGNAAAIRLITADNVGITETAVLEGVSVFPNPSEGLIQINVKDQGVYNVEVVNVLGETIYVGAMNGNTSVDLSSYTAGVYMVRVSTEKAAYTERVIVK
ncbi:MAG: T9SS type A sorting domain-containing protein, partial [Bacteroidetes bacterium]